MHSSFSAYTLAVCLAFILPRSAAGDSPPPEKTGKPSTDLFGEPLPSGARMRLGSTAFRPLGDAFAVRYTQDGANLVVSASQYGHGRGLQIFDAATGKRGKQFEGVLTSTFSSAIVTGSGYHEFHRPATWGVSPDGRLLATTERSTLYVRDLLTGKVVFQQQGELHCFTYVRFMPDGKHIAVVDQPQAKKDGFEANRPVYIRIWDIAHGKEKSKLIFPEDAKQGQAFWPTVFTFSPNGRYLAALGKETGEYQVIRLWDLTGKQGSRRLYGQKGSAGPIVFSADERQLAEVSGGKFRIWDPATGKQIKELDHNGVTCSALAFSPDGKRLAVDAADAFHILELASSKVLFSSPGWVAGFVFSADGRTLAIGKTDNSIRLLDAATFKELHKLEGSFSSGGTAEGTSIAAQQGLGRPFAFSPDGKTLAAVSKSGPIRRFDVATGKEIVLAGGNEGVVCSLAFSPNSKTLATAGVGVSLWDVRSGKDVNTLAKRSGYDLTASVAFSPDGKQVAAGADDGTISVWNAESGRRLWQRHEHLCKVSALQFLANDVLVSGGLDSGFIWWHLPTGRSTRTWRLQNPASDGALLICEVSPGAHMGITLASDGRKNGLCFWELATGKKRLTTEWEGPNQVSTHGRFLACHQPGWLKLTDLAKPKDSRYCKIAAGLPDSTRTVTFSHDGSCVAAVGADGVARVWDPTTGALLAEFPGHAGGGMTVAFSPDGKTLAVAAADSTILLWDVPSAAKKKTVPLLQPDASKLTTNERDALWQALAGDDASKAFDAQRRFILHPEEAAEVLRANLRPVISPEPAKLKQLLTDLDSGHFHVRSKAMDDLEALAELAEPALRAALAKNPPLEVRLRIDQLLAKRGGPITRPEQLRALRSVELLRCLGTPAARSLLETLANGAPGALVTQSARHALGNWAPNAPAR